MKEYVVKHIIYNQLILIPNINNRKKNNNNYNNQLPAIFSNETFMYNHDANDSKHLPCPKAVLTFTDARQLNRLTEAKYTKVTTVHNIKYLKNKREGKISR